MGVILPAYRRPGLVADFLAHWRSLGVANELVVVVDGPAAGATAEDLERRTRVIDVAERFASDEAHVSVVVRTRNTFGRALMTAYRELRHRFEALALLEEDNRISADGIRFLERAVTADERPGHAAAYTAASHLGDVPDEVRVSLFPEQWGVAVNAAFLERLEVVMRAGRIDRRVVSRAFRPILGTDPRFDHLVDRWLRRIRRGYLEGHEDAMLQYTAWTCGRPTAVPWETFVVDVGHLEGGGYTPRPAGGVESAPGHAPALQRSGAGLLCATCERRGAGEPRVRSTGLGLRRERAAADREWRRRRRERRASLAERDRYPGPSVP